MSRIDDLVRELCPGGVDVKRLGEVGQFIRGNGLQKKDFVNEGVGCIHYGQIYTHYGTSATETKSFVSTELAATLRSAMPGDLVVTTTSENIGDVGKSVAWLGDAPVAIGGHSCSFKHSLEPLYAAYFFQADDFHRQKRRFVKGTKVKELSTHDLARIEIPVPPMEIQREIVTILNSMEALEAELEAELEARRRQYDHYREELLSFNSEEVAWVSLAEIAKYVRGVTYSKSNESTDESGIGILRSNNISMESNTLNFENVKRVQQSVRVSSAQEFAAGDILMSAASGSRAHVGKVAYVSEPIPYTFGGFMAVVRAHDPSIARYLFQQLSSQRFAEHLDREISSTTINNLNSRIVGTFPIPIPPIGEMQRVTNILDCFDSLVTDASVGLSAEIAARRQQYEYYRDRLFDFPRLAA